MYCYEIKRIPIVIWDLYAAPLQLTQKNVEEKDAHSLHNSYFCV